MKSPGGAVEALPGCFLKIMIIGDFKNGYTIQKKYKSGSGCQSQLE